MQIPQLIQARKKPAARDTLREIFLREGIYKELRCVTMFQLLVLQAPMMGEKKSVHLGKGRDKVAGGDPPRSDFSSFFATATFLSTEQS